MTVLTAPQVAAGGGAVQAVPLEAPFVPFLLAWSPCGTRLALLSGWHHGQCVLRVSGFDVETLLSG